MLASTFHKSINYYYYYSKRFDNDSSRYSNTTYISRKQISSMNVMISFDSRSKKRIDTLNSPFISRDDLSISIFIKRVISRVTVIPILNEGLIITFLFFFFQTKNEEIKKFIE